MDNTATLVTGNSERTVSLSLSSAKERAAGKALMGLRNLKPDDIGMLRYTRASELETQVKCSNHAHDISAKKQVDLWHRDQRVAVAKLARGQQKMFRNLIRVQNDKRRIQRQARIRKQKEVQNELREKAVRDREEAQNRLRNMIMVEAMQQEEEVLPMKETVKALSPRRLPEIDEKPDMEFATTNDDLHSESDEQNERGKSTNHSMADDHNSQVKSEKQISSTVTSSSPSSTLTSSNLPSHNQPSTTQVGLPSTLRHTTSQILEEVSKANLPFIRTDTEQSFLPDIAHLISKPHFSREAKNSSGNPKLLDLSSSLKDGGENDRVVVNPNKVLPGINSSNTNRHSYAHQEGAETSERIEFPDSVFEEDVMMTGRSTKEPRKDKKRRKPSNELGELRDGKHKYHIGIANRSFRIPDYQAPVVTSVVRYQRNSEGSLVPSEVAVKPASEEYKLPSRRAEYMVEKALEWEKRREDVRQRKLQSFIGRMKEIERKEKLETRLAASLDSTRQTTSFHHHRQSHYPIPKDRSPPITHRQSMGESLEAYHIKGDVNDPKNCRYLRLGEDEGVPIGSDDHGRGKLGETKKRGRGRRQSSWGLVGMPRGFTVAEKTQDTHIPHHHNVII